jgi:3-oxoadipate enol-lactonase
MPVADLPGASLAYAVDGPPGAPAVVLSNSLGTDFALWDAQLPALLAAGLRVVRYDHRGHGGSSCPPGPYRLDDLGGDVLALLDALGLDRVAVAGVSLGGMIAQWLASRAPDRIGALALCCTSAYMPPASAWADRIAAVRRDGMGPIAASAPERWFTPGYVAAQPASVERIVAMIRATDPRGYVGCCAAIAAMDLRPDLSSIVAPTLVVAGADDPSTPPDHGRFIADAIDGARLVVVPSASHLAVVERAAALTALLVEHLAGGPGPAAGRTD